jgi:signal transduction histidine kinase
MAHQTLPETYFAPAARTSPEELERQIAAAANNVVIDSLLRGFAGVLVVVNAERQVVATNPSYLSDVGVSSPDVVLGLRPGEMLRCVHADEHPGGCGTTRFCETCGAALALVASQASGAADRRECVLAIRRGAEVVDLDMVASACPLEVDGFHFTALFLRDVSADKRRAAVERAFFHDLNNVLAALMGTSQLLETDRSGQWRDLAHDVVALVDRLSREVQLQRALSHDTPGSYSPSIEPVRASQVLDALATLFAHHPVSAGKTYLAVPWAADPIFTTDRHVLLRVVTNMLMNAFEATPPGGTVKLTVVPGDADVVFEVWNDAHIPPAIALRVFQRYFSTKQGAHRGQGTFVIRVFGETYLGGSVGFRSDAGSGTTFWVRIPLDRPKGSPVTAARSRPGSP